MENVLVKKNLKLKNCSTVYKIFMQFKRNLTKVDWKVLWEVLKIYGVGGCGQYGKSKSKKENARKLL